MDSLNKVLRVPFYGDTIEVLNKDGRPFASLSCIALNAGIRWKKETKGAVLTYRPFIAYIDEASPRFDKSFISVDKLSSWLHTVSPSAVLKRDKERFLIYLNNCEKDLAEYWIKRQDIDANK